MDGECVNCGESGNWCKCNDEEPPSPPIINFGHEWFDGGTWHRCVNCGCTDQGNAAERLCPNYKKERNMTKTRVKAVARVVLEVEASGVWGGDCSLDQIYKQASDSVQGLLTTSNKLLAEEIPKRVKSIQIAEIRVIPEERL